MGCGWHGERKKSWLDNGASMTEGLLIAEHASSKTWLFGLASQEAVGV
jgi:hypothetical protein